METVLFMFLTPFMVILIIRVRAHIRRGGETENKGKRIWFSNWLILNGKASWFRK